MDTGMLLNLSNFLTKVAFLDPLTGVLIVELAKYFLESSFRLILYLDCRLSLLAGQL